MPKAPAGSALPILYILFQMENWMHQTNPIVISPSRYIARLFIFCIFFNTTLWAQQVKLSNTDSPFNLKEAFELAWDRQPEVKSITLRRNAAQAKQEVANSWTAEPPSLDLFTKSDQVTSDQGRREYVAGVTLPLWLPGEQSRTSELASAEMRSVSSRVSAAQLRTSEKLRTAWWDWQRARDENALANARVINAKKLAADVSRRVNAGDLALSDQHQASGALASAEVAQAESDSRLARATQHLRSLTGVLPNSNVKQTPEPLPALPADFTKLDANHPAVKELFDRAQVARRTADLASAQNWKNPEVFLGTTRERGSYGESWQQSITLGVRIPFGSESRDRARIAQAQAEALESESQMRLERERLAADLEGSKILVESTRLQLVAAEKRARLAQESRVFFEKSFRLGETDFPTRLRIELESVEAQRGASRARIDLAAAVSTLRQNLGLLPE